MRRLNFLSAIGLTLGFDLDFPVYIDKKPLPRAGKFTGNRKQQRAAKKLRNKKRKRGSK